MRRFEFLAQHNMEAITRHFAGWVNGMADDLSRQNLEAFRQKAREYGFTEPIRLEFDKSLHDLLAPCTAPACDRGGMTLE